MTDYWEEPPADFYEDDEDPRDVHHAFEYGEKGLTRYPPLAERWWRMTNTSSSTGTTVTYVYRWAQ